jgi:ribosome maturation factor RimP
MTPDMTDKIEAMVLPLLEDTDIFLTDIRIKPTNNIKVFLDADGGLSIEKSAKVNRRLRALLDESGMFPDGDYSLEVSSPGIDEPLTSLRQYKKNIGRTVEVTPHEGPAVIGVMKEVTEDAVVLEVKIPKKKETKTEVVPLDQIKQTVVQVVF